MRILIPIILFALGLGWALYSGLVKKNWKEARTLFGIVIFFGGVWGMIFYWIFS